MKYQINKINWRGVVESNGIDTEHPLRDLILIMVVTTILYLTAIVLGLLTFIAIATILSK